MLIGYIRVSKSDGSQSTDMQRMALIADGVDESRIYEDHVSGAVAERPGLDACLKSLREGDTLVAWKLDRLGRSLRDLVALVENLNNWQCGLRILTGQGARINTTTPEGRMAFGIFAALAEFERALISKRTKKGIEAALARGISPGRRHKISRAHLLGIAEMMKDRTTDPGDVCREMNISRTTLYRLVSPSEDHGNIPMTERSGLLANACLIGGRRAERLHDSRPGVRETVSDKCLLPLLVSLGHL